MNSTNLKLYDFVQAEFKLSETKAKEFITILNDSIAEDIKTNSIEYRSLLKDDFRSIDLKFHQMDLKIEQFKLDLIKWMIGVFIPLMLAVMGLYLKH